MYSVEWSESRIDYFVDSDRFFSVDASGGRLLPTSEMFIIFDQAVDSWLFPPGSGAGDYNGTAGVQMRVAWVRAYVEKQQGKQMESRTDCGPVPSAAWASWIGRGVRALKSRV